MRRASLLLLCACSSTPTVTSDASMPMTDAGIDVAMEDHAMMDASTEQPSFCTMETPQVAPMGNGFQATTTHYDLYAEATQAQTTDMARLLEASNAAFQNFFERPSPAFKLKVKYFKDQQAWIAGLQADGVSAPTDAGGYYAPSTKTAYLYAQGNPYYSHVLLVHEAVHQFHYLTRLKSLKLPFWYAEGHAEYLGRHDWDGSCVRLGVTSLLSWEDLPSQAKNPDVPSILNGSSTSRADAWALFRYLDKTEHEKLTLYRGEMDASGMASFPMIIGDPASLNAPLASWIPTQQEPMKPIYIEWIHVDSKRVIVDTPTFFSMALVKAKATHFEATIEASSVWTAGAVVAFTDDKNYLGVLHSSDGKVRTFTMTNGSAIWDEIGNAPTASPEKIDANVSQGVATVTFNGQPFTVTPSMTPRVGLCASDTKARFVDIQWK